MSLVQIVNKVREAENELRKVAVWVAKQPESYSAKMSYESVERHRDQLAQELQGALESSRREVCRYSYLVDLESVPIAAVGETLGAFREMLAHALSAVNSRPVNRNAKPEKEFYDRTNLGLGFCFSGSIGIGLVAPSPTKEEEYQASLYEELNRGDIHDAIEVVESLADSKTGKAWNSQSEKLGFATVATFQKWLKTHYQFQLPVTVSLRADATDSPLTFSMNRIVKTLELVSKSREEVQETRDVSGVITEILTSGSPRVKLLLDNGTELSAAVPLEYPVGQLRVRTPATFEVQVTYKLNYEPEAQEQGTRCKLISASWKQG